MKRQSFTKLFNLFAILLLIFSLFSPVSLLADSDVGKESTQAGKVTALENLVKLQESKLQRKGEINPKLLRQTRTLTTDPKVSVIVQLSEAPVALEKGKSELLKKKLSTTQINKIKQKVNLQQLNITKKLTQLNIPYTEKASFNRTLNAIVIDVKQSDLRKIANLPGVVRIDPDEEVHALETPSDEINTTMSNSNYHLNVPEVWDLGQTGKGIKVGVIDTGVDYHHPDLKDIYKGGKNFVEHDEGYARDRAADDAYETSPLDKPEHMPEFDDRGNSFYTSHGTHVAGIIAGAGKNEYNIKGVAPDIDLYSYRVLGAYGSGMTSWVIAGIEQSVEDEMNVINLSLGGGSNSEDDPTAIAVNNATLEGVVVVSATGNSGPGLGSIGTPATSPLGIAVGNSTLNEVVYSATVTVEAGEYKKESDISLMAWTFGKDLSDSLKDEFEIVAIPNVGNKEDFEDLDVEGKVALISRGEIPFVDKIDAAKEAGAVAALIHNNVATGPANVFLGDSFDWIPTFDMATEEGEALRQALIESTGTVTFSNITEEIIEGDELNDSSSRGPTTPNLDIKPDVVAPGTNIMATVPAYKKDFPDTSYEQAYDRKTGTSMAAPQVTGVVALLLQKHPDWDPFDVKIALTNTAKKLDTKKYNVFEQGAGLIQPLKALQAPAKAYVTEEWDIEDEETGLVLDTIFVQKGSVTFGRVAPDSEETITLEKTIEIEGTTGDFSVELQETIKGIGAEVSIDKDSFTLNGKETITVSVSIEPGEDTPNNVFAGYINVISNETEVSLPYAIELSETQPFGVTLFELQDYAISPENLDKVYETELHFSMLHNEEQVTFELFNLENPEDGAYGDGYIGVLLAQDVPAGNWVLPIDGEYIDWLYLHFGLAYWEPIPDGVYRIDYNSWEIKQEELVDIHTLADDGPFFVKRTDPALSFDQVKLEDNNLQLDVTVIDKFVEYIPVIEAAYDEEFDLNDYINTTFQLIDEEDNVLEEGEIILSEDGSFTLDLDNIKPEYNLALSVEDIAKNSTTEIISVADLVNPADITVTLEASTEDFSFDPITVSVETNSLSNIISAKWLEGEKTLEDFVHGGKAIDIKSMTFDVYENGTYTVYVRNSLGKEAIATITIENIVKPFTLSLDQSPTEETSNPVTITIDSDSPVDLVTVKWLEGERSEEDFKEAGTEVDLESMSFEVEENGIYTVYAKNEQNVEATATITIDNIKEIEEPAEPKDLTVQLTGTPNEERTAVTITVDSDSEADLSSAKWLQGKVKEADFAESGNEIDLDELEFTVDENEYYTVFVENSQGELGIATIAVLDIRDPEHGNVEAEIKYSTELDEEGNEKVEIVLDNIEATGDLEALRWLEGARSIDDFENVDSGEVSAFNSNNLNGEEIDLETRSFTVDKNGIYTIYARDTEGERGVFLIAIESFEENEDTEGTDPGDGDGGEGEGTDPGDGDGDEGEGTDPGDGDGDEGEGTDPGDGDGGEGEGTDPGDGDGDEGEGTDPGDGDGGEGEGTDPGDGDGDEGEGTDPGEVDGDSGDGTGSGKGDDGEKPSTEVKTDEEAAEETEDPEGDTLPKTATPWYNIMLLGTILLAIGLFVFITRRIENKLYEQ